MIDVKEAYWRLKREEAALNILRLKARKEVFQYRELSANSAKTRCDEDMPLTKAPMNWMMENPRPEIKTLDALAEWCAMPKGELQNHIASGDLPTSQTTSITISNSVVWTMQNTNSATQ
jgi:hypothetical protein